MEYPIKIYFVRTLSFIVPKSIQIRRLKKIENRAKAIADKKNIPFLIRCKILEEYERKPDSYTSIGFTYQYEQMKDGKYCINIYRSYGMDSEQELLKTIFHEYGHLIDFCTPKQTKNDLRILYEDNKFPRTWFGTYKEDFVELFASYMLDLIPLDNEISRIMNEIILNGVAVLSNGEKKKAVDSASLK